MKKSFLGLLTLLAIFSAKSQTVSFTQQVAYYNASQTFNGATFTNSSTAEVTMTTAVNSASQVVAWRKFNTASDNTGSNRPMTIGDQFSITVNASQAKGQIGVSLLTSPSSTTTFADRFNNYALQVNLDGPDNTGAGYGNWYITYASGATTSANFGGAQSSFSDYQIDFTLVAADRMNVTITNLSSSTSFTFNDVQLNSSNPITDFSIYTSDADNGTSVAKPVVWKQTTSISDLGSIDIGKSNNSFSIGNSLTDGTDVVTNAANSNSLTKWGTGNITLGAASTYTGTTNFNAGTITMGAANALPDYTNLGNTVPGDIIFNGGNFSSGSSTGFGLGGASNPAGRVSLILNGTISLGTGSHDLYFSNSSTATWITGKTLTINGWVGSTAGGTAGRIFFGSNSSGLNSTRLSKITFTGYGTGAQILSTGEVVPVFNAAPTVTASAMNFTNVQLTQMTVNFTPGNGTGGRIVIARSAAPPTTGPSNGNDTYTANSIYGSGTGIGGGFVVFKQTGSASTTQSFTVTGLTKGVTYYFDVYEYNGSGSGTIYGSKYESSQATPASYTTVADGNWESTSVWACNCTPPNNEPVTINNSITLTQNEFPSDLTISNTGTLNDGGFTLTVSSSATNNGTASGTGEIKLSGTNNLPISGSGTYGNVESAITSSGVLVLNSSVTIGGNLINNNNPVSIGANTLTVNGALTGTGTLTGSSSSSLTLGGNAGTIKLTTTNASTRSLKNLSLSTGSSNATLGSDLDLYGAVTFSATGTPAINFNSNHVTLKSTSTANGTVGNISGGSITGATNFTAERFINNVRRAYRSISSGGITTSGSINANWQEGQMNTVVGVNVNSNPGYGTQITGTGGNTNGFDVTQTNQNSLYTYSPTAGAYVAVSGTSGTISPLTAYLMYIRGDRSIDLTSTANPLPTSSTTLRTTGTLLTGNQVFSGLKGNTTGSSSSGYNFVTNPFASFIDFSAIVSDNNSYASSHGTGVISSTYSYNDPGIGSQGGYIYYNTSNNTFAPSASNGHTVTGIIQPGQSFFIQCYNGGSAVPDPHFFINESHKVNTGLNATVFKAEDNRTIFRAQLYFPENGINKLIDGIAILFDDQYSFAIDKYDSPDRPFGENIAVTEGTTNLQIESRPSLAGADTIKLFLSNLTTKNYVLELKPSNLNNPGTTAFLIDRFLGTNSAIDMTTTTLVPFTVTSNAASSASNRFYIVFNTTSALPVTLNSIKAYKVNSGNEVDWSSSQEINVVKYDIERSADGVNFSQVGSQPAKGNTSTLTYYNFIDQSPLSGTNFYRVKAVDKNGAVTYSAIVSLKVDQSIVNISVFPNPVVGNNINIRFENMPKGNYDAIISNSIGQTILNKKINYQGGTSVETIIVDGSFPSGVYDLKVGPKTIKLIKQ